MIIRIYLRGLINNMIIHNKMIIRIYLNNKGLINTIIHNKIKCLVNRKDLIHHNNNKKMLINQVIYLIITIHGHKIRIYLIISIIIQLIITIKIIYFSNHNKDHFNHNNHLINNHHFNHHKIQELIYLIKTKIKINLCRL